MTEGVFCHCSTVCMCTQMVEYGYGTLAMISRSPVTVFGIPVNRLLEVGLSYEV